MKTYYKYTSNLGITYFNEPKIKISNPAYLNDPFESESDDELFSAVNENLDRMNIQDYKNNGRELLNAFLKSNGIVSVSETPRNLLMWSHYADEHRGLCIGFSDQIFSDAKKPNKPIHVVAEYEPQKVNYDNYRFDKHKEYASNATESLKKYLLTKGDDWIYEKEHRFIIPFSCATSIMVDKKKGGEISDFDNKMKIDACIGSLLSTKSIQNVGDKKNEYEILDDRGHDLFSAFSSFGCVSFLYKINPIHIHSVHMGLRVSDDYVIKLYNKVNDSSLNLSHVKLFRFKLSSQRFEIIPEIIDHDYISKLKTNPTKKPLIHLLSPTSTVVEHP